jgi:Tol biopolymer transport system component
VLAALVLFGIIGAILLIRRPWEAVMQPAAVPGESGDIVFMSNRDGDWDLYRLTLATGELLNLTGAGDDGDGYDDDAFPAFSADGGALTFLSNRTRSADGRLDAFLINADGTDVRPLQNDLPTILNIVGSGRFNWELTFAVSQVMAFVTLRDLNLEIYTQVQDPASGTPIERNLTQNRAIDWFPAWSYDGMWLAFASDRDGQGTEDQEIYRIEAAGGTPTRLTNHPADDLYPAWTEDNRVLFYSERERTLRGGALPLYILDPFAPTGDPLPITDGVFRADPQYTPDGRARLYMSNLDGDWDIYYESLTGGGVVNLTGPADSADDVFALWRTG